MSYRSQATPRAPCGWWPFGFEKAAKAIPDFTKLQFGVAAPASADGTVTVNFDIGLSSDFSQLTSLRLLFASPGGANYSVTITRAAADQNFVYSYALPSYAPNGYYTLVNIELTTNSGNYLKYEGTMFSEHNLNNVASLTNPYGDDAPPSLDMLEVTRNAIGDDGRIDIVIAGHLSDNLSGVTDNVQVDIVPDTAGGRAGPALPTSYTFADGSFTAGFTFGPFQQSGWYKVRAVTSFDHAGNHGTGEDYLTAKPVTFYIDNPNQDITPPTISGFQIRAEYDGTTNRPILVAEADVADAQSGLFQFAVNMISPNGVTSYNIDGSQISGDSHAGHYRGETALPIDGVSGTFTLNLIRAIDSIRNFNEVLGSDAAVMGLTTTINVFYPQALDGGVTTVTGSSQADYVFGSNLTDDTLNGGGGNDYLFAGAGNDTVYAGAGNDFIVGGDGAGNDAYNGGTGVDTIKYTSARDGIVVNLGAGSATSRKGSDAAGIGTDTLVSIENIIAGNFDDRIVGSTAANRLQGMDGNDVLSGRGGNDRIEGGAGNDVLIGGAGNDILIGGTGNDTANYGDASAGVTVRLSVTGAQDTGGAGFDALSSIENLSGSVYADSLSGGGSANRLSGGAGNDTLAGLGGNDAISGGAGDDKLYGGAGRDTLTGGSGADAFIFDTAPVTRDTITDFNRADGDRIVLSKASFSGLSYTGTLHAENFHAGAGATTPVAATDRLIYNTATGILYYDADGPGGASANPLATLGTTVHPVLAFADIEIIA